MSYCSIITFQDAKASGAIDYQNAWLGAAFIWDVLYKKYLTGGDHRSRRTTRSCRTLFRGPWDLAQDGRLPLFERAVHAAMFDHAIVRREHFAQFAAHLREFASEYAGRACHLVAWASFIESCEAEAIAFYGTSVVENPWISYDEHEDPVPYDLNTMDRHFEVYDWLETPSVRE